MIGRFVTRKFASRADFEAQRPYEILEARNKFVIVGFRRMVEILIGESEDSMAQGEGLLAVADGGGTSAVEPGDEALQGTVARTLVESATHLISPEDPAVYQLFLRGVFTENQANFEWAERGVFTREGVLIDRAIEDHGRKAPGTVWTLDAILEWMTDAGR